MLGPLIIIVCVVVVCIYHNNQKKASRSKEGLTTSSLEILLRNSQRRFRLNVEDDLVLGEDSNPHIPAFRFSIIGLVEAPSSNIPVNYSLYAKDITDGEENSMLVWAAIEDLQMEDTMMFHWQSNSFSLPYEANYLSDWVRVVDIPQELLIFPKRGKRKIKFILQIRFMKEVLATAVKTIEYENSSLGYVEVTENRKRTEELTLQLAVAVSAADNELEPNEGRIVRKWVDKKISGVIEKSQEKERQRLVAAVAKAFNLYQEGQSLNIDQICKNLVSIGTPAQRYEAFELCLQVAKADGVAAEKEVKFVSMLAEKLEIDKHRFHEMVDKILPVEIHEKPDEEQLIGLDPEMSLEEKKKYLRQQYAKWKPKVTHADPKVRRQAEEMLSIIAKLRSEIS